MSLPALFTAELPLFHPCLISIRSSNVLNVFELSRLGGLNLGLVWASNPDNKSMYQNKCRFFSPHATL